jgi:flagellar biosynthetic protein FliP
MKSRLALAVAAFALVFLVLPDLAHSQGLPVLNVAQDGARGTRYSLTLELLALMTVLTALPSLLLMMTPFIRIVIVMSLLRQALGTGQTPPNQVLVGLSLFLSFFIMAPVLDQVYQQAVIPYVNNTMPLDKAIAAAEPPLRKFMLNQTRQEELAAFSNLAEKGGQKAADSRSVGFWTLVPAFITSELKSAFTIGFLIYIPFIVIDLVVASVLMSLGMMMLSPMMVSLPLKLMLFVLVDGWSLTVGSLANSFVL